MHNSRNRSSGSNPSLTSSLPSYKSRDYTQGAQSVQSSTEYDSCSGISYTPSSPPPTRTYTIPCYDERTTLVPHSGPPSEKSRKPLFTFIFVIFILISWYTECTINTDRSEVRDRIRRQWARESGTHQSELRQWEIERSAWAVERKHWAQENVKWKNEQRARDFIRRDWNIALLKHEKWVERVEEQRTEWDIEVKEHLRMKENMDVEKKKWEEERLKHHEADTDWEQRDRRRREEQEERDKAALFFAPLERGKCTTYDTRRYRAQLENVPFDFAGNVLRACMDTPADINGRSVKPIYCEDLGSAGLWGTWEVDGEPACNPWWSQYKDKGCTAPGSGLREIEQHIENLYPQESYDWRDICIKTPASFGGRRYPGPHNCANWGSYEKPYIFGYWRVTDETC